MLYEKDGRGFVRGIKKDHHLRQGRTTATALRHHRSTFGMLSDVKTILSSVHPIESLGEIGILNCYIDSDETEY